MASEAGRPKFGVPPPFPSSRTRQARCTWLKEPLAVPVGGQRRSPRTQTWASPEPSQRPHSSNTTASAVSFGDWDDDNEMDPHADGPSPSSSPMQSFAQSSMPAGDWTGTFGDRVAEFAQMMAPNQAGMPDTTAAATTMEASLLSDDSLGNSGSSVQGVDLEVPDGDLQAPDGGEPNDPRSADRRRFDLIVNRVLIAGTIAIPLYLLFTVDSDIWRGWTYQEVIVNALPESWKAYNKANVETPIPVKSIITAATYFLGDLLAQRFAVADRYDVDDTVSVGSATDNYLSGLGVKTTLGWWDRNTQWLGDLDRARLFRGVCVGAVLGPLAHYYYEFNNEYLGDYPLLIKIAFDQTAYLFLYNAIYLVLLRLLEGASWDKALEDYRKDWWTMLSSGWKLWPAVGLITYTVIPLDQRLLWIDSIEIIYSALLSTIASTQAEDGDAELEHGEKQEEIA